MQEYSLSLLHRIRRTITNTEAAIRISLLLNFRHNLVMILLGTTRKLVTLHYFVVSIESYCIRCKLFGCLFALLYQKLFSLLEQLVYMGLDSKVQSLGRIP